MNREGVAKPMQEVDKKRASLALKVFAKNIPFFLTRMAAQANATATAAAPGASDASASTAVVTAPSPTIVGASIVAVGHPLSMIMALPPSARSSLAAFPSHSAFGAALRPNIPAASLSARKGAAAWSFP